MRTKSTVAFLMVFCVSLFSYRLGSTPILLSDLALLVWFSCSVVLLRRLDVTRVGILAMSWLLVALISGLVLLLSPYSQLDGIEYLRSLARGLLGVAMVFVTGPTMRWLGIEQVGLSIKHTIRVHALLIVLQVASLYLFEVNMMSYVSKLFGNLVWIDRDFSYIYVSGLFAEPAWWGWCVSLYIFSILAFYKRSPECHLQYGDVILVVIAAGLSQSFTAVALVGLALVAHLWEMASRTGLRRQIGVALTTGLVLIGAIALGGSFFARNIVTRLASVLSFTDQSLRDRFAGGAEAIMIMASREPLTGVGLGNIEASIKHISPELKYKPPGYFDLHMTWASAIVSTGLVGGVIYLLMLVVLVANRRARWVGVGLLLVSLVYGGFLNDSLWWFIGIGAAFCVSRDQIEACCGGE